MSNNQEIEQYVAWAFCRDPSKIYAYPSDIADHFDPKGKWGKVIDSMFLLKSKRIPITLEAVAETGVISYEELKNANYSCTSQMLRDVDSNLKIVSLYGKKRQFLKSLQESHRLLTITDVFGVEETIDRINEDISRANNSQKEIGTYIVGDIIDEYFSKKKEETKWKIPLGFTWVNRLAGGGIGCKKMIVLSGQYKQGKTQVARTMVWNASQWLFKNDFGGVAHIAHDGGGKHSHGLFYVAMEIQRICLENNIPIFGAGYDENNQFGDMPYITPDNIDAIIRNETLPMQIPKEIVDLILFYVEQFRTKKLAGSSNLSIFDGSVIRHSVERTLSLFERQMNDGVKLFMFDHVGKLGDPKSEEYRKNSYAAQAMTAFVQENDCALIVLSQINQSGIDADEDDENPHLKGGGTFAEECDMLFKIKQVQSKSGEKRIRMKLSHSRDSKMGKAVSTLLVPHFASGLVVEED